jgi:hypothetical protein
MVRDYLSGLLRGGLQPRSEPHLRSFIALRDLAEQVRIELENTVKFIAISDLPSWTGSDSWSSLTQRGYTHYLLATPRPISVDKIGVTWKAGRFTNTGNRALEALFKTPTHISIPPENEKADILETRDKNVVKLDESRRLADSFRALFPETKPTLKFVIRCFDVDSILNASAEMREVRIEIMAYLSRNLRKGPWMSARILSKQEATAVCNEFKAGSSDIDVMIGGWLEDGPPIPGLNKKRVRSLIEIDDLMPQQQEGFATVYHYENSSDRFPPRLEEFCIPEGSFGMTVLEHLVQYIQVHGLKMQGISYVHKFKCVDG